MKGNRMKDALEKIARRGVPENTNLWPNIAANLNNNARKSFMKTLHIRPMLAIILALLVLLALTGVVYAIGRAFGYIADAGFVDRSFPVRVLKEPIGTNQNGISLTITKVVADVKHVVIRYSVIAPPPTYDMPPALKPGEPMCKLMPDFIARYIQLPDGSQIMSNGGGPHDNEFIVEFPPIPQDVDTITVVLGCDQGEATVHLVPAAPDAIMPVITLPTATIQALSTEMVHPAKTEPPTYNFNFVLENKVNLDDGYILSGYLQQQNGDNANFKTFAGSDIHITDSNGEPVIFEMAMAGNPNYWSIDNTNRREAWAIKIIGRDHAWPITISTQPILEFPSAEATSFPIDLGSNPQVGQTWRLNMDVPVENAGTIHIDSVNLFKGIAPLEDPSSYGLNFSITNGINESPIVTLIDKDHPSSLLGGGGGPEGYSVALLYEKGFQPKGNLVITVLYQNQIPGPLVQATFRP